MGGSATTSAILVFFVGMLFYQIHGNRLGGRCDFYEGRWVSDKTNFTYNTSTCPFILDQFDCQMNGRPDKGYLTYRWQPKECDLPRFDGRDMLLKMRGKSLMFVGDSISLNQWQSLTCMLHLSVPHIKYTIVRADTLSVFSFPNFKVKIMFDRNPFLVDIKGGSKYGRVLKLDSMTSSRRWTNVDVLIFNSWHWWLHTGRKQPWDRIEEGNVSHIDMNRLVAYEKALNTWAKWVDTLSLDHTKTKLFFQGVSPDHVNSKDWGQPTAKSCVGQTSPSDGHNYPAGRHPAELVLEKVLHGISKPVHLLNITRLSQLRKDGHPSNYTHGGKLAMDCSHWCLAGIPDTWNQLLYATILQIRIN